MLQRGADRTWPVPVQVGDVEQGQAQAGDEPREAAVGPATGCDQDCAGDRKGENEHTEAECAQEGEGPTGSENQPYDEPFPAR